MKNRGYSEYLRKCKKCKSFFWSASKYSKICGVCDGRGMYKLLKPRNKKGKLPSL